ncbi:hypothetical protein CU044_2111 [Streptomyces sp. L-9-10]|nr:hypothetical protein CU044_2111 [Streptomyces sp. L-9-10]
MFGNWRTAAPMGQSCAVWEWDIVVSGSVRGGRDRGCGS